MKCFKENCKFVISSAENLKIHLKYIHNMKFNDDYRCPVEDCGKFYTRSDNFYRHYSKHFPYLLGKYRFFLVYVMFINNNH